MNVELVIADYFISNRERGDFSIKNIKNKLHVSEASLSRVAKKCGFKGFREFIYRYEEGFLDAKDGSRRSESFESVYHTYNELLNRSYKLIDEKQLMRISKMMASAAKVLVLGIGHSGLAAHEMQQRFMRLGVLVEVSDSPDIIRMQSVFQKEGSLVNAISISGLKEEVLFALKHSKIRGAKTVLITANNKQNYPYADEIIRIPSVDNLDHTNIISPQFPVLIILDVCYSLFFNDDKDEKSKLHKETLESLNQ